MSDLEKLKQLDPQEVFKKTYIAPKVFHQLISGDFSKIGNRAKALGFVAILERELGLDLSELRSKIDEFYGHGEDGSVFEIKEKEDQKSDGKWIVWALLLLVVGVVGVLVWSNYTSSVKKPQNEVTSSFFDDNETQESRTVSDSNKSEENITDGSSFAALSKGQNLEMNGSEENGEINGTKEEESNRSIQNQNEQNESVEEQVLLPSITILPKKKIWIGILYLDNYKRKNYVTSKPVELNTSRDQLIITGHGAFSVEVDGQILEHNRSGKVRMLYRAGKIEVIDVTTFKQYNKGKDW